MAEKRYHQEWTRPLIIASLGGVVATIIGGVVLAKFYPSIVSENGHQRYEEVSNVESRDIPDRSTSNTGANRDTLKESDLNHPGYEEAVREESREVPKRPAANTEGNSDALERQVQQADLPKRLPEEIVRKPRLKPSYVIQNGGSTFIPMLKTAISASFEDRLGVEYADITISTDGYDVVKHPAMGTRRTITFKTDSGTYIVHILNIDWQGKKVTLRIVK